MFCWSYEIDFDAELLRLVVDRQQATRDGIRRQADAGDDAHIGLWEQASAGLGAEKKFTRQLLGEH